MRIAVINKKRCNPKRCNSECMHFCPKNRSGIKTVEIGERAQIDEPTCIGCGICVKKCPFNAISIVNLPENTGDVVHKYGKNGFRIFNLPTMKKGTVIGILGKNGIGKTTALDILSGEIIPNLGEGATEEDVIKRFSGTENQAHFQNLYSKKTRVSKKPQHIDGIPKMFDDKVEELLRRIDERGIMEDIVKELNLGNCLKKKPKSLSGGELQSLAIAATLLKDAELYIFDEPSSYLDIRQRMDASRAIRKFTKDKMALVVEHDLIMLGYMSDLIHIMFGKQSVYGIISHPLSEKEGINAFIEGYLQNENIRFREKPLEFMKSRGFSQIQGEEFFSWQGFSKKLGEFDLKANPSQILLSEMVGAIGANGIGKTTFARILSGKIKPTEGELKKKVRIAYKPQHLKPDSRTVKGAVKNQKLLSELNLLMLSEEKLESLSGGELQKVAIGETLAKDAELYILDEPSAHLDVEERINVSKVIKRAVMESKKAAIVIDHDLMLLDYLSDRIMIFRGIPGKSGETLGPMDPKKAMNLFLKDMGISFRKESTTNRPRANKENSVKDREQKKRGDFWS